MALDPLTAILNVGGQIIDKIFPDKTEAEKAKVKMAELAQAGEFKDVELLLAQIEVNKVEAASESVFVAGWRPFIGWVCGTAMAYYYVLQPFLIWLLDVFNVDTSMPALNSGELMTVLLGMLGLGAFRSFDKRQNTNGKGGS